MDGIIRGKFSDTHLGRQLRFLSQCLDSQLRRNDLKPAICTCCAAEGLTADPQWKSVRLTLEGQMADARLNAAAPELLAALRAIVEFADHGTPVHPGSVVIDDARAAIARATGQD